MGKERMLTVLVPIKGDEDWIVDLETTPTISNTEENVIYRYGGIYVRRYGDTIVRGVKDREFPEIGKPLEIFDFQYDATRMGEAPVITASDVKWSTCLDDIWTQECHVSFGGENYYIKQIPTSSKSNEDARYRYDMSFISERYVLETVYFYDVVSAYATDKPMNESAKFSFYGTVKELAKRLNTSLVRSGLSRFVTYTTGDGTDLAPISIREWNDSPVSGDEDRRSQYDHFHGDYTAYLHGDDTYTQHIEYDSDGNPVVEGYRVVVDDGVELEEKFVSFDNDTIQGALQEVKDTWGLQYYIKREKNSDGAYTGTTLIVIGDSEYDFGEERPFQYGIDNELLSIEKTNTTEEIVTRCTGTGSEENIPYYYPNPTPDGWIKPVCMRDGEEVRPIGNIHQEVIEYAKEGDADYEKYLKNYIGQIFTYGRKILSVNRFYTDERYSSYETSFNESGATLCYSFTVGQQVSVKTAGFECTWGGTTVEYHLFLDGTEITSASNAFLKDGGSGVLAAGEYNLVYVITFNDGAPSDVDDVQYYYYPQKSARWSVLDTWGLQHLMTILLSALSLSAIRTLLWTFDSFDADMPAFLSTNPNLKFRPSADGNELGWYDGNRRIRKEEMIFGDTGTEYYAFMGGNGAQTVGAGDVYKVSFGNQIWTYNLQIAGLEADADAIDVVNFFTRINYNEYWTAITSNEIIDVDYDVDKFISNYINFEFDGYLVDGWYKGGTKIDLSDYGMRERENFDPVFGDTIEFKRVKYLTPQQKLMPEVYYRTDGEHRFYNAVRYSKDGEADWAIGEDYLYNQLTSEPDDWATAYTNYYRQTLDGYVKIDDADAPDFSNGVYFERGKVKNEIYRKDDGSNGYYDFENEYVQRLPREHIEEFEDVKPTIKGLVYNGHRIDVAAEYGYDEHDDDTIWQQGEDGTEGEYKHPHFFIKLRPLGFNLFDMALQEDMEISLTSGHCGSCVFKVKVDENTKKNPVQVWEQDVYRLVDGEYVLEAHKGDLKRYRTYPLYTESHEPISDRSYLINGGVVRSATASDVTTAQILNGQSGTIRKTASTKIEGNVITSGRFQHNTEEDGIDQQDTTDKSVWIALEKDTDTFGVLMPSVVSNYVNGDIMSTIRPVSVADTGDEDTADTFVILKIKMPQMYIRSAEHELSREIVKYMYEHNPQKYNFSINFSRIYLADNIDVESHINENSVLYVKYNGKVFKQYVAQYSYKMSHDQPLPEITVTMNEELSAVRNSDARNKRLRASIRHDIDAAIGSGYRDVAADVARNYVSRNGVSVVQGNIISRTANASIADLKLVSDKSTADIAVNKLSVDNDVAKINSNLSAISAYSTSVSNVLKQIKYTMETRIANEDDNGCHRVAYGDGWQAFWANTDGTFNNAELVCTSITVPTLNLNLNN